MMIEGKVSDLSKRERRCIRWQNRWAMMSLIAKRWMRGEHLRLNVLKSIGQLQ